MGHAIWFGYTASVTKVLVSVFKGKIIHTYFGVRTFGERAYRKEWEGKKTEMILTIYWKNLI